MMVSERERNAYCSSYDYDALRSDRYRRSDVESNYEIDRNRTSSSYRDSLMNDLERPAAKSRLERADEDRFGFYMANIPTADNNYDRFWDKKHAAEKEQKSAPAPKRKLAFMVTYLVVAVVALIAVTLTVVGMGEKKVVVSKTIESEKPMASAETDVENTSFAAVVASEEEAATPAFGGENYILLKDGELVAIELPTRSEKTKEEEKGFDKFCTWLNEVFGG